MKRMFVWFIDRPRGDDDSQGPVFYADHDYHPDAVRLMARRAPNGRDLQVDIRDDGVSIFTSNYAALNKGGTVEEHAEDYPDPLPEIEEGSVITLHVIQSAEAEGITCQAEMDSLSDEDDDSE